MHLDETKKLVASTTSSSPSLTASQAPNLGSESTAVAKQPRDLRVDEQLSDFATSTYKWYISSQTLSCGVILGLVQYCITNSQLYFSDGKKTITRREHHVTRENWSIILFLWFIGRYFEFQRRIYCGQVERRWRICPLDVQMASPIWNYCKWGNTQMVLKLFSQGLSPYIKDGRGRSLLDVSRRECNKMCLVTYNMLTYIMD